MGTLGDSTSKRLAGIVRSVNAGGPAAGPGGKYYGGWNGGLGGTWGKAPTRRGEPSPNLLPAKSRLDAPFAQQNVSNNVGGCMASGRRDRIRPNSEGVRSLWETTEQKLPKAPAKGGRPGGFDRTQERPKTAVSARDRQRPVSALDPVEYTLSKEGFTATQTYPSSSLARPHTASTPPRGSGAQARAHQPFAEPYSRKRGSNDPMAIMATLAHGVTSMDLTPATGPLPPAMAAIIPEETTEFQLSDSGPMLRTFEEDVTASASVPVGRMLELEEEMRAALKKRRTVYENERQILENAFRKVDDGSGDIDPDEFLEIMRRFGIEDAQRSEAIALFQRYGCRNLRMSYIAFSRMLLSDASRQLAADVPIRKGAFAAGDVMAGREQSKIQYYPCKKPVYTPSDWEQPGCGDAVIARSSEVPDARLQLEFVYGYAGKDNTSANVFYNCLRQVVYYTAGLGVVYTPPPDDPDADSGHRQHFFLGHDDDIKSLAVCPAPVQVDQQPYPAHSIFATGQVSSQKHGPYVCIWDSRVGSQTGQPELRRISLPKTERGVCALGFSPDGHYLTVVAMDNAHSVYVYDWLNGRKVGEGRGFAGEPPQVFGVTWNPHITRRPDFTFATWGKKHCKLWNQRTQNGQLVWAPTQLSFGKYDLQNVHSAAFLPVSHALCLGLARGEVLVVEGTQAVRSIVAHRPGPQFIADDGNITYSGVRGMALHKENKQLLTAGADGVIQTWDIEDGQLTAGCRGAPMELKSPYGANEHAPVTRALTVSPLDEDIVLGTQNCDIWEVNEREQNVLIHGHSGDLYSLAWHPTRDAVFATACDASRVCVFDAAARDIIKTCPLNFVLRACAWSTQPMRGGEIHHLAIGGAKGKLLVLDEETLQPLWETKDSSQGISDIKYSPDGKLLAVATFDQHIDLYETGTRRYSKIARCSGHSSTVKHIDWSRCSSVLQSTCSAYEILYWNGRTGKQVTRNQRDTAWHTWTCALGFPVMGIWPDDADGTDINAVHRDADGEFVVTADDSGRVKLFNYPCVVEDAPHRAYIGHSSHVMCVRFSSDNTWVASAGGHDRAVFQFKLARIEALPEPEPAPEPQWGALDSTGKVFGWTTHPVVAAGTVAAVEAEVDNNEADEVDDETGGWER